MTPTTAHRAVLKIHMASEARPLTGTEAPSEHRQQAEGSKHTAAAQGHVEPGPVLTARGRHALHGGQVLDGARHAGARGDVDFQLARDVVQVGVWERCCHGPH